VTESERRGNADPRDPSAARDAILRARARELAQVREVQTGRVLSILPFEVGGETYGVEVTSVHQVLDAANVSPLLGAPRGVLGAIVSRTRPVPVLDLRSLLGLEGGGLTDLQRVVVLDDAGDLFGIAVERVAPRADLPADQLRAAEGGPFKWLGPERLAVLDPARLGLGAGEVR
jgi:purine-binding chemotaxis protein CheW